MRLVAREHTIYAGRPLGVDDDQTGERYGRTKPSGSYPAAIGDGSSRHRRP
jgi:hypothetical protein